MIWKTIIYKVTKQVTEVTKDETYKKNKRNGK